MDGPYEPGIPIPGGVSGSSHGSRETCISGSLLKERLLDEGLPMLKTKACNLDGVYVFRQR